MHDPTTHSVTIEPEINEMPPLADRWARIRRRLHAETGEVEYRTWLQQMTLAGRDGDEITLTLPTSVLRDRVSTCYGDRLSALWQAEDPSVRRVAVCVGAEALPSVPFAESPFPSSKPAPGVFRATVENLPPRGDSPRRLERDPARSAGATDDNGPKPAEAKPGGANAARPDEWIETRPDLAVPLDPRFTFENFVVGKPNEVAYACARRVAEQPSGAGINPLFLYGGVGLGKTHLMHAIARELVARPGKPVSVAYLSSENFMHRFIAAIRNQATAAFKETLRRIDVLMIDDLQFLIGKYKTQDELFHTFNYLVEQGRQIVVAADRSPSDPSGLEHRLRTRPDCGTVADLHGPTYELRLAILESKAARAGCDVPAEVLVLLAHKISSNVRRFEGALNRLVAHANLFGRPVTLETTHEVLHDLLKAHDRRVTIDAIQRKVADHFGIALTDMSSARRMQAVVRPRQVAMYLAKQLTSRSLPEIGRKFGNRDHTTVMHAVSRVTELMQRDDTFAEEVELLRRLLAS